MNRLMLGTLAVLVVVPAWSQELVPEIPSQEPVDTEVSAEAADERDDAASVAESLRADVNQVPNVGDGDREEFQIEFPEGAHGSTSGDWEWTLDRVLQVIGIIVLLVVILQTRSAIQKATNSNLIARDIGKKQLRAYVNMGKMKINWSDLSNPSFCFEVVNSGQTPAANVRQISYLRLDDYPPGPKFLESDVSTMAELENPTPISPGQKCSSTYVRFSKELTGEDIERIKSEKMAIYLNVLIAYDDVFGDAHTSRCCFYATGENYQKEMLHAEQGNEAT